MPMPMKIADSQRTEEPRRARLTLVASYPSGNAYLCFYRLYNYPHAQRMCILHLFEDNNFRNKSV